MREIEYALPGGWAEIDLAADLAPQIKAVVQRLVQGTAETERQRVIISASMRENLEGLRDQGARLFLMEAEPFMGVLTGVSITVFPFPSDLDEDPMDTLVSVASQTPGASVFEAGDLVVLRTVETDDRTEAVREQLGLVEADNLPTVDPGDVEAIRTSATYYVGHPGARDDWMVMVAQMSTRGDKAGKDLAEKLLGLCDATVGSVRFA
ncbi:hypothetical protein [Actinomyces trachealis]|uniref:hypothetical protein n=1 Tax=Actinomyces trachealis TaxID=2763540 RepID=UPI001892B74C|nr:hypothetical protein [Actinomyces trachealis]